MPKCTICTHDRREQIDLALVAGESLRPLALRFAVSATSLFRHKRHHIPADLARVVAARDLAPAIALAHQIRDQEAQGRDRALNVMAELQRTFERVTKLFDACDRWLADPDHPERYDLGPRAEELLVHYTHPGPGGARLRAPASLAALLARLDDPGAGGLAVDRVEIKTADPRELILKAAKRLESELQLVARLLGQLAEPQPTVNVLIASPEWLATRTAILRALEPYPEARAAVGEALALDPAAFARSLGLAPDPWQAEVLRWPGSRLLLNCARQTGKSTIASVLALHRAVYYPASLILLVSPSQRQSTELFRKVGALLDRLDLRPELFEDNRLSCVLANRSRIVSLPSNEATNPGFSGASLIVEDEAGRVSDDLYRAMRPMLATSGGRLVLMSTPFGKRGHFWQVWQDGGPEWQRFCIRATECPRISPAFLAEEQRSLGSWWYAQEYLCEFVDNATSAFTWDMVQAAQKEHVQTWNL